jgi:hypothetical protein
MALADIVNVQISKQTASVARTGFGTPLVMSHEARLLAAFAGILAKEYTEISQLATDLFSTTGPTYTIANAIFSQNPKVDKIVIGKRTSINFQRINLTVAAVRNSTAYSVIITGTTVTFTSDASATTAEIVAGLVTAINASAVSGAVTATDVASTTVQIDSDASGVLFILEVVDRALLNQFNVTLDPGIVADFNAIRTDPTGNDDWYVVVIDNPGAAEIQALATAVEAIPRMFAATSGDSDILTAATTDVASDLQLAAYARTFLLYHPQPFKGAGAAWAGRVLPFDPGSSTWKFKTLAGIEVYTLTPTERTNALGKNANIYERVAGRNITGEGVTSSGEFIDITHFIDFITARLMENVFFRLVNANKIPFTDAGIAIIENEVRGVMQLGISVGGFAADPAPVVTVPRAKDVSSIDKANRLLPDVTFSATLAGAIHEVEINGVVTV